MTGRPRSTRRERRHSRETERGRLCPRRCCVNCDRGESANAMIVDVKRIETVAPKDGQTWNARTIGRMFCLASEAPLPKSVAIVAPAVHLLGGRQGRRCSRDMPTPPECRRGSPSASWLAAAKVRSLRRDSMPAPPARCVNDDSANANDFGRLNDTPRGILTRERPKPRPW